MPGIAGSTLRRGRVQQKATGGATTYRMIYKDKSSEREREGERGMSGGEKRVVEDVGVRGGTRTRRDMDDSHIHRLPQPQRCSCGTAGK